MNSRFIKMQNQNFPNEVNTEPTLSPIREIENIFVDKKLYEELCKRDEHKVFSSEKESRINFLIRNQLENKNVKFFELYTGQTDINKTIKNGIMSWLDKVLFDNRIDVYHREFQDIKNFIGKRFQIDGGFIIVPDLSAKQEIILILNNKEIKINKISVLIVETTIGNSIDTYKKKVSQIIRNTLINYAMIEIGEFNFADQNQINDFYKIWVNNDEIVPISVLITNTDEKESIDNYQNYLKTNKNLFQEIGVFIKFIYKVEKSKRMEISDLINNIFVPSSYNYYIKVILKNAEATNKLLFDLYDISIKNTQVISQNLKKYHIYNSRKFDKLNNRLNQIDLNYKEIKNKQEALISDNEEFKKALVDINNSTNKKYEELKSLILELKNNK